MWRKLIDIIINSRSETERKKFVEAIVSIYNALSNCQYWYEEYCRAVKYNLKEEYPVPRIEWIRSVGALSRSFRDVSDILSIFSPETHKFLHNYYLHESLMANARDAIDILEQE